MASNLRSSTRKKNLPSTDPKEPTMDDDDSSSNPTTSTNNQTNSSNNNNNNDDKVKCAICLGDLVNRSHSNNCRHQFCYACLLEWSKVKPECPLCKLTFTSIYHNIRTERDYDVYQVPVAVNDTLAHTIHIPSSPMYHLHHHLEGEMVTLRSHRFHPYGPSSGHLHFPTSYQRDHHEYFRILVPLERRGALEHRNPFRTGQTEYFGTSVNLHNNEASSSSSNITNYQSRRRIYDRGQYVTPFGSSLQGAPINMFPSDEYIRNHSVSVSRISSWLHREITVLLGLRMSIDEMANVYDVIMNVLHNYDIRSRDFRELVHSYFGPTTRHFQHELYYFVLSGMRLEEYDRVAVYPPPPDGNHNNNHHPMSSNFTSTLTGPPPVVTIDSGDDEDGSGGEIIYNSNSRPIQTSSSIENFGNLRSLASSARNANTSSNNPNVPWDLTMVAHSSGDHSRPLTTDDFPALRFQERRQRQHEREREANPDITESALEDIIRRVASGDIEELFPDPTIANLIDHQETVNAGSAERRRRGGGGSRRGGVANIQQLNEMDQRLEIQMESLRQARSKLEQRRRETEENIEQIRQRNDHLLRRIQTHSSHQQHQLHHPGPSSHRHNHGEQQVVQSSSSDDEECVLLGVHPVTKKPPLAVITISDSSDEATIEDAQQLLLQSSISSANSSITTTSSSSGGQQFKNEIDYSAEIIQLPDPFHSFYQPCPQPSNSVTVSTTSNNTPYTSRQTRSSFRLEPNSVVTLSLPTSNTNLPTTHRHSSPSTSRKRKMTESSTSRTRSRSNKRGAGSASSGRKSQKQSIRKKARHSSEDSSPCSFTGGDEEEENNSRKDKSKRKRNKSSTKKTPKKKKSKRIIDSSGSSEEGSSVSSCSSYGDRRGHATSSKSSRKKSSKRKKEKKVKSKKSSSSSYRPVKSHRHSSNSRYSERAGATENQMNYSSTDNSETEDFIRPGLYNPTDKTHDRQQQKQEQIRDQSTDEHSSNFDVSSFLNTESTNEASQLSQQLHIQLHSDHSNSSIGNIYPTLATSDLESDDGTSTYKPMLTSSLSQSGNQSSSSSSSDLLENLPLTTDGQPSQARHNEDDSLFLLDLTVSRNDDSNFWSS